MRYLLAAVATFALALSVTPAFASIALQFVSAPTELQDPLSSNNDFKTNLNAIPLSLTKLVMGDIKAGADGFLNFYFHASESSFDDQFSIDGSPAFLETTSFTAWDPIGTLINPTPIAVSAGTTFSSLHALFSTASSGGLNATMNTVGFGIFVGSTIESDYTTLYFGYDDQATHPDDNHDDLIIRVDFIPSGTPSQGSLGVPEPVSAIVWSALVGIAISTPTAIRRRDR